jgi:hypothetical protein
MRLVGYLFGLSWAFIVVMIFVMLVLSLASDSD